LDRYAVDNLALAISHVKGIQQHQDDGLNELVNFLNLLFKNI